MQDTPDQVYFALCTTNPEKLKEALKSRCHLTTLTPLSYRDTVTLLRDVVGKEKAKISLEVLDAIAEMAHGSAREALVKLEGCLGLSEEEALEVLKSGNEETHPAFELCRCMLNQSGWSAYGAILKDIPAVEVESVRQMVLSYMYSVLVKSPQDRPARIIAEFKNPFYDSGRAGLALAAYKVYTLGR
jgi:DNA polymerase III delta prime subunit